MLPWGNLGFCYLNRYRKVYFKLTNSSALKAICFYSLKQQGKGPQLNNNAANVGSTRDYCNLFALAFELALFRFATPR